MNFDICNEFCANFRQGRKQKNVLIVLIKFQNFLLAFLADE